MKKKILVAMATGLLLMGTTAACIADDDGLSRSITTTMSTASFYHYVSVGYGQSIMVEQRICEEKPVPGSNMVELNFDSHHNTMVGAATTATTKRPVTSGYKYSYIEWTQGYVDGTPHSYQGYKGVQ